MEQNEFMAYTKDNTKYLIQTAGYFVLITNMDNKHPEVRSWRVVFIGEELSVEALMKLYRENRFITSSDFTGSMKKDYRIFYLGGENPMKPDINSFGRTSPICEMDKVIFREK